MLIIVANDIPCPQSHVRSSHYANLTDTPFSYQGCRSQRHSSWREWLEWYVMALTDPSMFEPSSVLFPGKEIRALAPLRIVPPW